MRDKLSANVCLIQLELYFPEAHSLKEKRMILRRIKDRLRNKFNISLAEIGFQDLWQRTMLGIACISSDHTILEQTIERISDEIEQLSPGNLIRFNVDFL